MEISKAYEPQAVEEKWYNFWLNEKCFVADAGSPKPAYSIVIPPPNVTGVLHMGHVLNNTIQDILARKARMDGKEVLWLPGTDHAGIATEGMVAKQIWKEKKKSKRDIGREEFIKRVWQWKEKHGGIIIEQLKKLGCSCDWTRERFTMDPEYVRNVQRVFVDLYKKGLIYRGKRMVNWCPATLTALSDEEVDMETQKGSLYYFKVEVVDVVGQATAPAGSPAGDSPANSAGKTGAGADARTTNAGGVACATTGMFLTIATTRPETIPGDTAIAVNPKDPRYAQFIGKHAIRPLPTELPREQKLIPIIGDEYVDFEFGTGVLKVTPAHDKNDFEIGQRHNLPAVDIMNPNATMNDLAGADLTGMDRFEARAKAVELLRDMDALVKEEPYENKIGFSQRARVPIEPRLSEQWFLKYPSVEASKACVEQPGSAGVSPASATTQEAGGTPALPGKMRFHPQRWAKVYGHWMTNIQDWCISRQLWWGHRIPVWHSTTECAHTLREKARELLKMAEKDYPNLIKVDWAAGERNDDTARRYGVPAQMGRMVEIEACMSPELNSLARDLETLGFQQDPDVLDTWFSSWLWPFATLGWAGDKAQDSNNPTLQKFYPTIDLVTGPDIIFFWVARMIMAGYEFMGEMPFRNVYFTGIIRDKQGRKMSKQLGNSPDPLDLIARYGADAMRFGTMRSAPLGQDVLFDEKDVELGRNFCNKLWNACRFRQMQGGEVQGEINSSLLTSDDKWILLKLNQAIREITDAFSEYKFNEATQTLYRFFWSEFCDWYLEASKATLTRPVEASKRESVEAESASDSFPSPLSPLPSDGRGIKGEGQERAGVRGENLDERSISPSPHPTLSPPAGSGEGNARHANTLAVIDFVLSHTLRLFHPFLPFITEELWHGMGYAADMPETQGGKTIMFAPWPKPFDADFRDHYSLDDCYLEFAQAKYDVVSEGRNLRRIGNIQAGKKVKFVLKPNREIVPHDIAVIKILLNAEALEINESFSAKKGTPTAHTPLGELFLPLEGHVDPATEIARLTKEKEKIQADIVKAEQKLSNPAFTQKVPPQVLQEHQRRLADGQAKLAHVVEALKAFEG